MKLRVRGFLGINNAMSPTAIPVIIDQNTAQVAMECKDMRNVDISTTTARKRYGGTIYSYTDNGTLYSITGMYQMIRSDRAEFFLLCTGGVIYKI